VVGYNITMNRVEQMENVQKKALEMFTKKNKDYGDAFAKFGVIGILMRIEDKIQRSLSITKNGVNMVDDEGIRDTLMDLHNYAAMGVMLLDENKEKQRVVKNLRFI
jgi:beta-glucosidase/6-phospho-beta-glucosidase/beta-galactosidase|tara:strand:- start:52067 stop:52384 length:318 start_codon:yes stop_codon:yes gene_type:complete